MHKYEKIELTNMCMIYDNDGNVVVQEKLNKNWGGITFPGGHVETGESFVDSVIREVKEMKIEGMMCGHCQATVEKALKGVPGVSEVVVSLEDKNAVVTAEKSVSADALKAAVVDAGYEVTNIQ